MRFLFPLISLFTTLYGNVPLKVNHPFPTHIHYKQSISPSGYRQDQLDKNTFNFYKIWKRDFLVKEENYYRVATDKKDKSRTVSEGQGYGMLIVAYFAGSDPEAQKIFNGLYRFSRKYPSAICPTFMTWQIPVKKGESDSAFDGDADIAYALLLADKQWGSKGDINYKKEAYKILDAILKFTVGKESHLPLLGDWVNQNGKKYNQYTTRTSDFMISHFRTFSKIHKDSRWIQMIHATQKAMQQIQNLPQNKSTLIPDFIYYNKIKKEFQPTQKHFLEEEDNSYYYNACRIPWRVGTDALLNNNPTSQRISQKMLYWVWLKSQKKPENIKSGYTLEGKPIGNYPSTAFIAPFGVAAKNNLHMQDFLDAIYDYIKDRHENYYEDSINLICQLIITNNYWDPAQY
jgi:endo-1,4-beta-D-glucanase Y